MTAPQEGQGEVHVLHVTQLDMDTEECEYLIEHPTGCPKVERADGGTPWIEWSCDVEWNVQNAGLLFCLRYSGTPVDKPGRYEIQAWWRKHYVWDAWAWEHDAGLVLVDK